MSDSYIDLINKGPAKKIAKALGLPQPVRLRRFTAGDAPARTEPVLVVGDTPGGDYVSTLLLDNGFAVHRTADPRSRYQAIVATYDGVRRPGDLDRATLATAAGIKRLAGNGRIVTISEAELDPSAATDLDPAELAALNAARRGVTGITRSAAHEMRAGSTVNGIVLDGVDVTAPSAVAALWFLLSAKSAYVDGQFLTVSASTGAAPGNLGFHATGDDASAPLAGKVAVVTGAARGIGAAIAATLHRDGARIYGVDVPAAGEGLAATMNAVGGTAIQLDITSEDAAGAIHRAVGGPIDVFVHNAGITRDKLLANMDSGRWESVIGVNIESQLRINAGLWELGAFGEHPHVVSLASTSGIAGNRGQTNYAASKAGVIGMVGASAARFAEAGGSINAVAPGFIETEMTAKMPALTRQIARRLNSLQQGGQPQDVAEAIAFLASDAAGGINGTVLRVCGQNMVGA